jgi:Glyoxalase-like domain
MTVRWVWTFLDLPEREFPSSVEFWRQVTRTSLSPWRGQYREFATLLPEEGDPWVKVQRVGGPGGTHLDLDVDEPLPQAAARAARVGATIVGEYEDLVVCRSPGGFVFCLTPWAPPEGSLGQVRAGAPSLLDQVCLDIPEGGYAAEVRFWSELTGWAVEPEHPDEFVRLAWPAGLPVRFLLQRLEEAAGAVRAHVDLAATDRGEEVARHVALGAAREGEGRGWTVMRDPAGQRYCVTDRDPQATPRASTS